MWENSSPYCGQLPAFDKIEPAWIYIWIDDNDVIHVIDRLGKQLTTLMLDGGYLTDVTYL
jgi:hypothetical protein